MTQNDAHYVCIPKGWIQNIKEESAMPIRSGVDVMIFKNIFAKNFCEKIGVFDS
jgi:hypothetical protein